QPQFAEHRVVGVSWYAPALQVTVEGFHKRFSSLGQFQERNSDRPEFAQGRGRARGLDVYLRWQTEQHALWGSYTLSEVTEQFRNQEPRHATHYQPHEVKGAYELTLPNWAFSVTNVWGSPTAEDDTPYWRTDVGATYFLPMERADTEVGLSILNLFNRRNPRIGQTYLLPEGDSYATLGIPFTASVYARVRLHRIPGF
ncbi:MAG TPA: hypothetical protein DCE41_32785, partial [Cytophagales bacterium]|nr:hypothetical protein [Cytophagales bacterium]